MQIKPKYMTGRILLRSPEILGVALKRKAKELDIKTSELIRFLLRHVYSFDSYYSDKDALMRDMIQSEREEHELDKAYHQGIKDSNEKIEQEIKQN